MIDAVSWSDAGALAAPLPGDVSPRIELSIIIVNWNTQALLGQCLAAVRASMDRLAPAAVEVFVLDNASSDGSAAMVRSQFPWTHLIVNDVNVGFARANNQAIDQANGRYVLLLNSDAIMPAQGLLHLWSFAEAHPRAGVVGVKLLNPDGTFQAAGNDFPTLLTTLAQPWDLIQKVQANPYYPSHPPHRARAAAQCDWVGGACLLARRQAIEEVGLLDTSFFMNSEEVDWCFRMRQRGWEVWYTPDVEVVHFGGGSADRRSAAQRMRSFEGKVRFLRKHHGALAAQLARLNFRISSLTKAAWYQARFMSSGDTQVRAIARAYWRVATEAHWV